MPLGLEKDLIFSMTSWHGMSPEVVSTLYGLEQDLRVSMTSWLELCRLHSPEFVDVSHLSEIGIRIKD